MDLKALRIWNRILDYCRAMEPDFCLVLERCVPIRLRRGVMEVRVDDAAVIEVLSSEATQKQLPPILQKATRTQVDKVNSLELRRVGLLSDPLEKKPIKLERVESLLKEELTLRSMRKKLGLSQAKIARMIGCSVESFSHWESGARRPRWASIESLAKLFEVDVEVMVKILGGSYKPQDSKSGKPEKQEDELGEKGEPVRYEVRFNPPECDPDWSLIPWFERVGAND